MNIDYLLIVDTLFKVSLGISLTFGCLWLTKYWREQHSPLKANMEHKRIHLLEEISYEVGRVNHSFAKYSALVIESTRFGKRWPPDRRAELTRVNAELVTEFERLATAEAKLLMLGEKTMERTLRLYAAKIAFFRKQVYVGRQDISEQEIADIKTAIMQLREQFYDLLSRRYDKLLAA
jgi:hypothetical protein